MYISGSDIEFPVLSLRSCPQREASGVSCGTGGPGEWMCPVRLPEYSPGICGTAPRLHGLQYPGRIGAFVLLDLQAGIQRFLNL